MVDLLVADDLRMREGVKDALGSELSPSLFPVLLKHLKSIVAHFFEHDRPKPQSPFTHFIEQAITMLRLFFERITDPLTDQASERVSELIIDFARYTNRLSGLSNDYAGLSIRIKYKMAQLCEMVVSDYNKEKVPLVRSAVVKNQMIDYLLSWSSAVTLVCGSLARVFPSHFLLRPGCTEASIRSTNQVSCVSAEDASRHRANRDLTMACLKALGAFYDGLKLQPRHRLHRNELMTSNVVFTRLYSRHFDYLMFLLSDTAKLEVRVCLS